MSIMISSCNTTKHLPLKASLVKKNQIIFKSDRVIPAKAMIEEELSTIIRQKPNGKFFGIVPREWLYFHILKSQGEEPVIFNDSLARRSAKDMENYLKFKKGYYHAKVDYLTEDFEKLKSYANTGRTDMWIENTTNVIYLVALGDRYKIKSINYEGDDKPMIDFVNSIRSQSLIKVGDYINFDAFEKEKFRLSAALQNEGYQGFSSNYMEINGDSSQVNQLIDITLKFRSIQNIQQGVKGHTRYSVGAINVYTDYVKEETGLRLIKEQIGLITFFRQSQSHLVKPSLLDSKIFLKSGDLLRKDDRTKTFRKLSNLSTYRFVTINSTKDVLHDSIMNFDIILTPHLNRWTLDGEIGTYLSTLNRAYLWGLKTSASLQNRNTFGGSEQYTLKAEIGSEFGANLAPLTSSISIQNTLSFPTFNDYIGLGKFTNKLGILKRKSYQNFVDEANTEVHLGYSYNQFIQFYNIRSIQSSYGYDYTTVKGNRYIYKPLGINLDIYNIIDSSRFNPIALLSFTDNLGTGFLLRDFTAVVNYPKNRHGIFFTLYNNFELSGLEVDLANRLYNVLSGQDVEWQIYNTRNIRFAKYIRNEIDIRMRKDFPKSRTLATRFNLGVIVPFGRDGVSPFIRQFSSGGPNSMRGWRLRELGPGGYRDPAELITAIPNFFFNQGDFKLELNAEYRFKLFYFFEAAIFTDIGNVWTLKKDVKRPLSNISASFYDQLAVAAGWGLRFNFDYFIIRFDFGYKLRAPYADPKNGTHWYSRQDIASQGIGNVQVAVNFPF